MPRADQNQRCLCPIDVSPRGSLVDVSDLEESSKVPVENTPIHCHILFFLLPVKRGQYTLFAVLLLLSIRNYLYLHTPRFTNYAENIKELLERKKS